MLRNLEIQRIIKKVKKLCEQSGAKEELCESLIKFLQAFQLPDEKTFRYPIEDEEIARCLRAKVSDNYKDALKIIYETPVNYLTQLCMYNERPLSLVKLWIILKKRRNTKRLLLKTFQKRLIQLSRTKWRDVIKIENNYIYRRLYPGEFAKQRDIIEAICSSEPTREEILEAYIARLQFHPNLSNDENHEGKDK